MLADKMQDDAGAVALEKCNIDLTYIWMLDEAADIAKASDSNTGGTGIIGQDKRAASLLAPPPIDRMKYIQVGGELVAMSYREGSFLRRAWTGSIAPPRGRGGSAPCLAGCTRIAAAYSGSGQEPISHFGRRCQVSLRNDLVSILRRKQV